MSKEQARQFAVDVAKVAADLKAEDLVILDLTGISTIMDFVVIGTGTSDRQLRSAAEAIITHGKASGQRPLGYCGQENATWIVVDYVDVVVHLFARAYREYYDLELLWGDAPRVPIA